MTPAKRTISLTSSQWGRLIGGNASETGSGPGSYDIRQSVWHVNVGSPFFMEGPLACVADKTKCCNPKINGGGGWGIFNALFGWQNSATYGSVIAYILYWVVIILAFFAMRYKETNGHWPLLAATSSRASDKSNDGSNAEEGKAAFTEKPAEDGGVTTNVRSVRSGTPSSVSFVHRS